MTEILPRPPADLAHKRPAVATVRPVARPQNYQGARRPRPSATPVRVRETLIGSREVIGREVRRISASGELVDTSELRPIKHGVHVGLFELTVLRQPKHRAPKWTKVCIGAGVLLGTLSAVFVFAYRALQLLSLASFLGFAAVVLVALAILTAAGRGTRTKGVTVTAVAVASVTVR